MGKIAQVLNKEQIEHFYLPMTKRLSTGDWFTSRTSACSLFAPVYPKSNAIIQEELRKLFAQLCKDDTPMVRRAAAANFPVRVGACVCVHVFNSVYAEFIVEIG
jgi:serine/threonine-protein phosphatase 2A regulatory subunit A